MPSSDTPSPPPGTVAQSNKLPWTPQNSTISGQTKRIGSGMIYPNLSIRSREVHWSPTCSYLPPTCHRPGLPHPPSTAHIISPSWLGHFASGKAHCDSLDLSEFLVIFARHNFLHHPTPLWAVDRPRNCPRPIKPQSFPVGSSALGAACIILLGRCISTRHIGVSVRENHLQPAPTLSIS